MLHILRLGRTGPCVRRLVDWDVEQGVVRVSMQRAAGGRVMELRIRLRTVIMHVPVRFSSSTCLYSKVWNINYVIRYVTRQSVENIVN